MNELRKSTSPIYALEFSENGLVHYHVVLRFIDPQMGNEALADECFSRWERYGFRSKQAFDLKPVTDRKGLVRYMAKRPKEGEEVHPERWQKLLPLALHERGLGANWWGYVNRSRVKMKQVTTVPNPFE